MKTPFFSLQRILQFLFVLFYLIFYVPSTNIQLHARIQEFSPRGGGGGGGVSPGQSDKKSSDNVFFFCFSPQLILQKSNGQFQRNLSCFKVLEGVQHFPGRGGPIAYSL